MPNTSDTFSPKQERALAALLNGATVAAAADTAGVHPSTIVEWKKLPAFAGALHAARRDVVSQVSGLLVQACTTAVATLTAIMDDATTSAAARVRAARTILDYAYKAVEMDDLAARLTALEAALPGEQKPHPTASPQTRVAQAEGQVKRLQQAKTEARIGRVCRGLIFEDLQRARALIRAGCDAEGIFDPARLSAEEAAELARLEEKAAQGKPALASAITPVKMPDDAGQAVEAQVEPEPEQQPVPDTPKPPVTTDVYPPRPHIETFLKEVWQPTLWVIPEPLNLTEVTLQQRRQFEHAVARCTDLPGGIPALYQRLRARLGQVGQSPCPRLRQQLVEIIHNLKPWWHGPVFDLLIKAVDDDYIDTMREHGRRPEYLYTSPY